MDGQIGQCLQELHALSQPQERGEEEEQPLKRQGGVGKVASKKPLREVESKEGGGSREDRSIIIVYDCLYCCGVHTTSRRRRVCTMYVYMHACICND